MAPGASDLQERDLPLVVGGSSRRSRERSQGIRWQSREHGRGRPGSATGDAGSLAQGRDERRAGDPDRDADAARHVRDRVGLEERLLDDEIGAPGGEPEGESRARVVAEGDATRAGAASGIVDEDATSPRGASQTPQAIMTPPAGPPGRARR